MVSKREVDDAYYRAVGWLIRQQEPDGSWLADFGFRHGPATSWPTAFVANRLPECLGPELFRARLFLRGTRNSHPFYGVGWGYNQHTPSDLDSTLEGLRAVGPVRGVDGCRFLGSRTRGGGFATYTHRDATMVYPGQSVRGWVNSHLEVAANVLMWARSWAGASSSGVDELVGATEDHILGFIRRYGYRAYWYHSPFAAAGLILKAFGRRHKQLPPILLPLAVADLDWETQHNPFICALAIEAAMIWDRVRYAAVIEHLARQLLKLQLTDGSWRPLLVLSVPYPDRCDPRWVQHINADYRQPIISVATVVAALQRLRGE